MNRILSGTTAITAVMFLAQPALAQITPEDVWQNWQDAAASGGYTIDGASVARDGDTLTISGATFGVADGAGGTIAIPISPIAMTDRGDGTVSITLPETIVLDAPPAPTGETLAMTLSLPGFETVASGTLDAVTYASTIPSATVDFVVAGGPSTGDMALAITGGAAQTTYATEGERMAVDGDFTADSMTLNGTFNDGEAGSSGTVALSLAALSSATQGNLFDPGDTTDLGPALQDGLAISSGLDFGAMSLVIDGTDAAGPSRVAFDAASGSTGFGMSAEGLDYSVGLNGAALVVSGADIPLPELRIGLGEFLMSFAMPLVAAPEPADFAVVTRLVDLTLADDLWGMVDPTAQFPRDPATLIVDASGKATLTTSLVDETAMTALGETPPGTLDALNLNALQVTAGGANVTGDGALTFDNTDLETFGGVPAPTGTINLSATGVNGLIDKLVAMGVVPEDQAMGARMMLSMFANVASDGSDSMTSVVEFRDKGLFVNGQQLQ
jgi:hypothetical protein